MGRPSRRAAHPRGRAADGCAARRDGRAIPLARRSSRPAQRARVRGDHVRGHRCGARRGRLGPQRHDRCGRTLAVRPSLVKAFVLAASLALVACGTGSGASDRLTRSADAMEHVRGVRFSLVATSVATGGGSGAGDLALEYPPTGQLRPPARLRLTVTMPRPAVLLIVGKTITLDGEPASPAVWRTLPSPIAVPEPP